ncbi:DUF6894 family protein [Mesorhizobium argentiipisi]|uniref:DUF6894 family protein n=1 Tax=Mesorhizobium argentiipisi TaxID=3015175 RepID=UPI0039F46AE9
MPTFFFDVSDAGDVYHDAHGTSLPSEEAAKIRGFAIVSKLMLQKGRTEGDDVVCTIRDITGHQIMQIALVSGAPVVRA